MATFLPRDGQVQGTKSNTLPTPKAARALAAALLEWYAAAGRDLPWRREPSPYAVVVAETMLQQTRVEAVVPYYERFLSAFPDFSSLAKAERDEVLRLWEGLGYYRRAERLHELARAVVRHHGGVLPSAQEDLLRLPGIGPYTAAAVRAFAFGLPGAPVDANVRRVLRRLAPEEDAHALCEALMAVDPFSVGQALMDLGAGVCRARRPRCEACPWRDACATRGEGWTAARAGPRPEQDVEMLLVARQGELLVGQRRQGLLRGLYGLPLLPEHDLSACQLAAGRELGRFRHVFTHRVWNVRVVARAWRGGGVPPDFAFVPVASLSALPFGRPFRRALALWTAPGEEPTGSHQEV
jgi:A/G-specific adenine glycosylase